MSDSEIVPTPLWMTLQLHLLVLDLHERIGERLDGTVHVALHDHGELLHLAFLDLRRDVVERRQADLAEVLLALQLLAAQADLRAPRGRSGTTWKRVARLRECRRDRSAAPASRARGFDAVAALVEHGAHLAAVDARR